jgi:hypothetical protein
METNAVIKGRIIELKLYIIKPQFNHQGYLGFAVVPWLVTSFTFIEKAADAFIVPASNDGNLQQFSAVHVIAKEKISATLRCFVNSNWRQKILITISGAARWTFHGETPATDRRTGWLLSDAGSGSGIILLIFGTFNRWIAVKVNWLVWLVIL